MQCNASEFQSVYLTGPRAILYNVYTFVAYFIWPSWRAQFRSIEVTNTFEDSEGNLCHFWSPLSFIFKKAVFVFVYKIYKKKTSFINFLSFEFLKRGIFGTTSILLHHFSTIAFKNGDVLREDNLCSEETFAQVITKFLQFSDSTTRQCPPSPVSASPPAAAASCWGCRSPPPWRPSAASRPPRPTVTSTRVSCKVMVSYWGSSIFNLFVVRCASRRATHTIIPYS